MDKAANEEILKKAIELLKPFTFPEVLKELESFLKPLMVDNPLGAYGLNHPTLTVNSQVVQGNGVTNLIFLSWNPKPGTEPIVEPIVSCIIGDYLTILRFSKPYQESKISYAWSSRKTLCLSTPVVNVWTKPNNEEDPRTIPATNKENL